MKDKNVKILIVDDDVIIADFICDVLIDNDYKNVEIAYSYNEALSLFNNFNPSIILLDINLKNSKTGIELSTLKNPTTSVIFLTGQLDNSTMQKAMLTNPEAYLTKPLKKHDLLAAIQLTVIRKRLKSFTFKDGHHEVSLEYDHILFFNADGNYTHIYTTNKKYTIRQSLTSLINDLPRDIFKQTHRSFIININKVTRKASSKIIINNIEIPISRTFDKMLKKTV